CADSVCATTQTTTSMRRGTPKAIRIVDSCSTARPPTTGKHDAPALVRVCRWRDRHPVADHRLRQLVRLTSKGLDAPPPRPGSGVAGAVIPVKWRSACDGES